MRGSHGPMIALGLALLAAGLVGLGALHLSDPAVARGVMMEIASQLLVGQEASIPVALAAKVPPSITIAYAIAQDAVVLLLGFPLLTALRHRLERTSWGADFFRGVERAARAAAPRNEWRAALVLAATTWIPFLPSGALFAAFVGALLGLRARFLLPFLVGARAVSAVVFTLAYGRIFTAAEALDPRLPLAAAGVIVVAFVAGGWLVGRRRAGKPAEA